MVFQWLSISYPHVRRVTFAIPNGGGRDIREAVNLKKQGVSPGVFDIFISVARNGFHGLYIELKVGRNKLTKEQKIFQEEVSRENYATKVCYSFESVKEAVEDYLSYD